jgi:hypothetical protein
MSKLLESSSFFSIEAIPKYLFYGFHYLKIYLVRYSPHFFSNIAKSGYEQNPVIPIRLSLIEFSGKKFATVCANQPARKTLEQKKKKRNLSHLLTWYT